MTFVHFAIERRTDKTAQTLVTAGFIKYQPQTKKEKNVIKTLILESKIMCFFYGSKKNDEPDE